MCINDMNNITADILFWRLDDLEEQGVLFSFVYKQKLIDY